MDLSKIAKMDDHAHSEYSNERLIDSINKIPDMMRIAYSLGYAGITLTDHETLSGHVEWLQTEKKLKEKGEIPQDFKCGLGNEIYLVNDRNDIERYFHYILIAKNSQGHRALRELSSIAWLNGFSSRGMMRVPTEKRELEQIVAKYPNSLIATNACFTAGQKVRTKRGDINIEDITSNDYIFTSKGTWEKINFPTSREYHDDGYNIYIAKEENKITATKNHQFLILNDSDNLVWIEAQDLKKNMRLVEPLESFRYSNIDTIDTTQIESISTFRERYPHKFHINSSIKITNELMRTFGLWLGDGSITESEKTKRVNFTFNSEEFPYYYNFVQKGLKEIGLNENDYQINHRKDSHRVDLVINKVEVFYLFKHIFGVTHAFTKHIPKQLLHISKDLDSELWLGYFLADGYFRYRPNKGGEVVAVSVSQQLIRDIHHLSQSLYLNGSIKTKGEYVNSCHHNTSYYFTIPSAVLGKNIIKKTEISHEKLMSTLRNNFNSKKGKNRTVIIVNNIPYFIKRIKQIEKICIDEQVYCLNTDSHNFTLNNVIVHNCIGGEIGARVLALIKAEAENNEQEIYNLKLAIDDFIKWNLDLFGDDFYFEIAAGTSPDQRKFNKRVKSIAEFYGLKMIIGSDAHYLTSDYRAAHKGYLNSKEGEREVDAFYWDAHFMNNDEAYNNIKDIYSEEEFVQMCNNSMEIYDKIEGYSLAHSSIIPEVDVFNYPKGNIKIEEYKDYPIIAGLLTSNDKQERYWINQCLEALEEKELFKPSYLERLEIEADVIKTIGEKLNDCLFKYFNTFQHYINLFWECGSIVGPGRGSSVCFLSNYLLGITQLDPLEWELPYWRFLNKERVELPDIDIDLAPSKRPKILEKIREERGPLNVLQVCTFGTEGTRSAIAAAGRGYRSEKYPNGLEVEITQYLSSLVPMERGFLWGIDEVINGNVEKDRKPVQAFIDEVAKYPGLLELIQSIEGLICRRGIHASGVILYNESPFETNAIMRSPDGSLTTQFDLHQSEWAGDVKYDLLVTEICDKLTTCIELLQREGLVDPNKDLREIYNEYLHPAVLNLEDNRLWDALAEGSVLDVFQFSTGVGLATAKQVKPRNPTELTSANALMRLMGEKGKERPLDRYCRIKQDINRWYNEVRTIGLSEEEIKILEPYYLPNYGVPASQEDLMLVCLDPKLAHFTLKEANAARKTVAKKHMGEIPALHKKFVEQCPNPRLGEYVWETTMGPQMGYAFARPHALAYSFVGIQTLYLATNFPPIFWNCACLIVSAGGTDLLNVDFNGEDDDEKKKNKNVNYGKISKAIGESKAKGIEVAPPDINQSDLIFKPDFYNNRILYGLKGITRVGTDLVYEIFKHRPYTSVTDFCNKVKVNKLQATYLIKSGAFDNLYNGNRLAAMNEYLMSVADQKKRITLQNMNMLIEKDLIPEELDLERKVYNFNKYLKKFKSGKYYNLDNASYNFFTRNFNEDLLEDVHVEEDNNSAKIMQTLWDTIYQNAMDPVRNWMKANQKEILDTLNNTLYQETYDKYAAGSLSEWEMESLSFYYHDHELINLNNRKYGIVDFNYLNEEPVVDRQFTTKDGSEITMFEISRIAGTVIDKDKNKSEIILLTTSGVVTVKVWKNQYAKWDKQISERGEDGKKHVVEKSFFSKGTKLIITGIRRGDNFIPKKYKSTDYPLFEKIISLSDDGSTIVDFAIERAEVAE